MTRLPACALGLAVLALTPALAGCGGSSASGSARSSSGSSASTSGAPGSGAAGAGASSPEQVAAAAFASHAGVAFGTFYRFIYAPYRAGAFNPASPNPAALAKARRAAVVVAHEIDIATRATRVSAALEQLRVPMATLDEGFKVALAKLKAGHFSLAEIQTANIAIGAIKGSASNAGLPIGERAASV
jgi:hypothetical protein